MARVSGSSKVGGFAQWCILLDLINRLGVAGAVLQTPPPFPPNLQNIIHPNHASQRGVRRRAIFVSLVKVVCQQVEGLLITGHTMSSFIHTTRVRQPYIYLAMRGRVGDNAIMTYTDPSHRGKFLAVRISLQFPFQYTGV